MADGAARIVVFGDVIDDVIATPSGVIRPDTDTPATIERRGGGSAANTAAWLATTGMAVDAGARRLLESHPRRVQGAEVADIVKR